MAWKDGWIEVNLKAVLFDLHGTLAYVEKPISSEEISLFLLERGLEVYPQSLDAASYYVSMIDYPKSGFKNWHSYLKQVMLRLDIEIDSVNLRELAQLYRKRRTYTLFSDAVPTLKRVNQLNLKAAVVTTIAHFAFQKAITPVQHYFNVVMTGYEAGCEKSNPKMHKKTVQKLGVTPNEAVMIGDSLLVDVKIPQELGMHTILLDRTGSLRGKPFNADAKAKTLIDAVTQIERWLET